MSYNTRGFFISLFSPGILTGAPGDIAVGESAIADSWDVLLKEYVSPGFIDEIPRNLRA